MFLEKVEISGFKSFKSLVEINLKSDINIIIGPNGSGKSNLLDAIRWGIGEQNNSILRVSRNIDLISSGISSQNNFSEVKLNFNNKEEKLKTFPKEFFLKRRLYRDGTNEYFFNGTLIKLSEYNELLDKLSIKHSHYMFINQGQIEKISNTKEVDLISLIEDAVGIDILKKELDEVDLRLQKIKQNIIYLNNKREEFKHRHDSLKNEFYIKNQYKKLKRNLENLEREHIIKTLFNVKREMELSRKSLESEEFANILKDNFQFQYNNSDDLSEKLNFIEKEINYFKDKIESLKQKISNDVMALNKLSLERREKEKINTNFTLLMQKIIKKQEEREEIIKKDSQLLLDKREHYKRVNEEIIDYTKNILDILSLVLKILKQTDLEEQQEGILREIEDYEKKLNFSALKTLKKKITEYFSNDNVLKSKIYNKIGPMLEEEEGLKQTLLSKNKVLDNLRLEIISLENKISPLVEEINKIKLEKDNNESVILNNKVAINFIEEKMDYYELLKRECLLELEEMEKALKVKEDEKKNLESKLNKSGKLSSLERGKTNFLEIISGSNYYEYLKKNSEYDVKLASLSQDQKKAFLSFYEENKDSSFLSLEKLEKEIHKIKIDISDLEKTNFISFNVEKEFEETSEKVETITKEVDDLKASQNHFYKLRTRIKREIDKKFEAAFQEVNKHFSIFFGKMFKGEGKLILNKDKTITIDISFKSKTFKKYKMLSGGEQTLVSICFLFALYYYSPAYFCILDEIDAALDFENSKKLSKLVNELSKNMQFLMITHNIYSCENSNNKFLGITLKHGESRIFNI